MLGSRKDSYKTPQTDPETQVWETREELNSEQRNQMGSWRMSAYLEARAQRADVAMPVWYRFLDKSIPRESDVVNHLSRE